MSFRLVAFSGGGRGEENGLIWGYSGISKTFNAF